MPCLAPSALLGRLLGTHTPHARLSASSLQDRDAAEHPNWLLPQPESGSAVLPAGTATGKCELGVSRHCNTKSSFARPVMAASAEVTITRARSFYGFAQFQVPDGIEEN